MNSEIEVLHQDGTAIVFRLSLRKYPSIAVQGDTLFLLSGRMTELMESNKLKDIDEESQFLLEYVESMLKYLLNTYDKYSSLPDPL